MGYPITMKNKSPDECFLFKLKLCRTARHGIAIELYRTWHVPLIFITRVRTYKLLNLSTINLDAVVKWPGMSLHSLVFGYIREWFTRNSAVLPINSPPDIEFYRYLIHMCAEIMAVHRNSIRYKKFSLLLIVINKNQIMMRAIYVRVYREN